MAINNPLIPGDPFSYDLKWIVRKINQHTATIEQILAEMPDESEIKQIFIDMLDSGEITALALQSIGIYNVKDYGAKGDGETNDHDAIMAAYADAADAEGILYFPAGTYMTDATLLFPKACHVVMEGEIFSNIPSIIVSVGDVNEGSYFHYQNWKIKGSSGANVGSVALQLQNITSSRFNIDQIRFVETGVRCLGNTKGFQNNTLILNEITDVKNGLILDGINGGWCNDNLFLGGRFTKFSSMAGVTTTGISITSSDGSYYNNNNVFIKPNLESNDVGVLFDYANYNHVYMPRMEAVAVSAQYQHDSVYNDVITGYGDLTETSQLNTQVRARKDQDFLKGSMKFETINYMSGSAMNASNGSINDIVQLQTSTGNTLYQSAAMKYSVNGGSLALTGVSYLGAVVDIVGDDQGVLFWKPIMEAENSTYIRGVFIMYDANNNPILTPPKFFPGRAAAALTSGNVTFFRYSASAIGYPFIVPAGVDHVFVGFETASGQTVNHKGLLIGSNIPFSIRRHAPTLSAVPTSSNGPAGQIVASPAASKLWIHTGSGTWNAVPV